MSSTGDRASAARHRAAGAATWQVLVVAVFVLAGIAAVGSWAQPWRFAAGNPELHGVATGTASGRVVGGCTAGGSRNEINCVQYVDFDAGDVKVRHAKVHVTDGFRHGSENPDDLPIVYDLQHPERFRLVEGNPGTLTRVLGTAWMSFVMLVGGTTGGVLLGGTLVGAVSSRRRGREARHLAE